MKVLIRFDENVIYFYDYTDYKKEDLSKTNILDLNEFVLSASFIEENFNFFYNYIKNKILKNRIDTIYLDKTSINEIVFKLINNISTLHYMYISETKKIDIETFKYLLTNKNIKIVDCYDMNIVTFDRLNLSRRIKIFTRKKIYKSNFYKENDIESYSDAYYRKEIIIDRLLDDDSLFDFENFIKNNHNLKTIKIKFFTYENLIKIINILGKYKKKNIKINIYENDYNVKAILKEITTIKKKTKKIIKKNNLNINIIYENDYIKKNIFKQYNLNLIKIILLSIIIITLIVYGLLYYMNKKNLEKIDNINEKVNNIINSIDLESFNKEEPKEQKKEQHTDIKTEKPKPKSAYFKNYSKVLSELKKLNKDTVGWLSLNNSIINYPVVQASDNEKYLNYSFDGVKNPNGWIYMDYRNNPNDLDKNTIIYGHSGNYYVMFGSLYKVLNKSWYTNKNNQIITFNTANNMNWQIFSIYTIDVTNDYLQTKFNTDEEYLNFLNLMSSRSIYDFGVALDPSNKILTLSTCYKDSNHRLVIHAKLIN